jgi:hypothetical protein
MCRIERAGCGSLMVIVCRTSSSYLSQPAVYQSQWPSTCRSTLHLVNHEMPAGAFMGSIARCCFRHDN